MRTTPAISASTPVRSLWAGPSFVMCAKCIAPFVVASTPNTSAIDALNPGRSRGKATIAAIPAASEIAAASAC